MRSVGVTAWTSFSQLNRPRSDSWLARLVTWVL
jgi:hypothetical protein